jgi:hypothetical protein
LSIVQFKKETVMGFKTVYVLQARGWSFTAVAVYDSEAAAHEGAALEGLEVGTYEVQQSQYRPDDTE